ARGAAPDHEALPRVRPCRLTSRWRGSPNTSDKRRLTGEVRMTGGTYRNLAAAMAAITLIMGGATDVQAQKKGGTIRVGNLGEPPTLDAHWTTASITETLTNHLYEGLLTLDDENQHTP